MNEPTPKTKVAPDMAANIATKARRKLRARRSRISGIWFGIGMMGLVGWSIAVPTLLGTALGIWLDQQAPGSRSWTLALLVAGLMLGCLNAWRWVIKEDRAIRDDGRHTDDE